jgi:putative hydrolase of the HAD superfamily
MGEGNMTVRAVLCDIYNTLLEVGPAPADAEHRWGALCRSKLPATIRLDLTDFAARTEPVIAREHNTARAAGIPHPEIFWPGIACEAWPALASLNAEALDDFLFEHAQLQRTVYLISSAADVLRSLAEQDICLGLVSNSQPYTLRELDVALSSAGLNRAMFASDLCFFSFEHGFSKPDPHVFRLLAARLALRGISPRETLVVGDREDNDFAPARTQQFRVWRLVAKSSHGESGDGNWRTLGNKLGAC